MLDCYCQMLALLCVLFCFFFVKSGLLFAFFSVCYWYSIALGLLRLLYSCFVFHPVVGPHRRKLDALPFLIGLFYFCFVLICFLKFCILFIAIVVSNLILFFVSVLVLNYVINWVWSVYTSAVCKILWVVLCYCGIIIVISMLISLMKWLKKMINLCLRVVV